jgi:hypothetical protein
MRDVLDGREVSWGVSDDPSDIARASGGPSGYGVAKGIDDAGCLLVTMGDGGSIALDAGEVHLGSAG